MAHIVKTQDSDQHRLAICADRDEGEVFLVRGGRLAYLWAGPKGGKCVTVSCRAVLRKLANEILKEIGNS
jgi:hypothetical protein